MSRIDQALKRVQSNKVEHSGTSVAETEPQPAEVEESVASTWQVGGFPTESPAPAVEQSEKSEQEPVRSSRRTRGFHPDFVEKMVTGKGFDPRSVEQYRRLAAALHHAQSDRGVKSVMVASAVPGEGKTLTAVNLALTLSESYRRRVLLIDADLRRPRIHELIGAANFGGLNEALRSLEERELSLVEVSPCLSVLPAGKPDPDPMGVLTSVRMSRLLSEAAAKFDWVVLDTPPVALLPDTNLLAAMIDVAVVVIHAGRTPYDMIERTIEAVGRDRVLGVVLNGAEPENSRYEYGYYAR